MKIKRTAALLLSVSMMMGLATTANATNNQVGESEHLDSKPVIVLELKNFPLFEDRRFHVTFYVCDMFGDWASKTISEQDFLFDNDCRFEVASSARYGVMNITNLYGNPSPSYTYTISRSNLLPMNEGGDLT